MSEWKKVKFLDYIELNPKVLINKGEVCPFIEMANVDCNMRQPRSFEYKPFTSGVKFQTYDTVIARIEPCLQNGKGFLYSEREAGFGSTEYLVFRAKDGKTNPLFVYYLMRTHEIKTLMCNSMSGATGRQRVNNDVFSNLEILCPSVDTQHRIATILSRYDSLIENYQKQIKLLEESAQRLYKEWFIDLRFPGHENTKIVDGIPEGWEKKPVSHLGEYLNGFAFKPSDWQENGKPIIKIKEMSNGVTKDTPRNNSNRVPEKYLVNPGDLLFSWSATLMVIIWTGEKGWLNQHLFKVTPTDGIGREFLLQTISNTIEEFHNLTTGSTMKHIQRNKLDQVFVNVPNKVTMDSFSSKAEIMRNSILSLSIQIRHLTEARDRLLPKLMSGEINV